MLVLLSSLCSRSESAMQSPGAGRAAQLMSELEPGCTQLDRRACTNASRPHPVVSGHAAICTILRNTAGSMARLRVAVEAVGALFERHTFLAVESGSTDGTRQALRKWQRAQPARVELILPSGGKPHHGYWRNRYLERVLAEPHKYRYMVVLDGDMPWLSQPEVGLSGIRDSLLNHDGLDWAAFVANGVNHYDGALYDTFAFRNDQFRWSPDTGDALCADMREGRCTSWVPMVRASRPDRRGEPSMPYATLGQGLWFRAKERFELRLPPHLPPLRVQSYFGGLGVYKVRYLEGCEYCQVRCTQAERQSNRSRLLCEPLSKTAVVGLRPMPLHSR